MARLVSGAERAGDGGIMPPVLIVAGTLAGWEALVRVFDVKPYLPAYDSVPEATVPEWANPATEGAAGEDAAP